MEIRRALLSDISGPSGVSALCDASGYSSVTEGGTAAGGGAEPERVDGVAPLCGAGPDGAALELKEK